MFHKPRSNVAIAIRQWIGVILFVSVSITTGSGSLQDNRDENPTYLGAEGRLRPLYSHVVTRGPGSHTATQSHSQLDAKSSFFPDSDDLATDEVTTGSSHPRKDSSTERRARLHGRFMKSRKGLPPQGQVSKTSSTLPKKQSFSGDLQTLLKKIASEEISPLTTEEAHQGRGKHQELPVQSTPQILSTDDSRETYYNVSVNPVSLTTAKTSQGESGNSRLQEANTELHDSVTMTVPSEFDIFRHNQLKHDNASILASADLDTEGIITAKATNLEGMGSISDDRNETDESVDDHVTIAYQPSVQSSMTSDSLNNLPDPAVGPSASFVRSQKITSHIQDQSLVSRDNSLSDNTLWNTTDETAEDLQSRDTVTSASVIPVDVENDSTIYISTNASSADDKTDMLFDTDHLDNEPMSMSTVTLSRETDRVYENPRSTHYPNANDVAGEPKTHLLTDMTIEKEDISIKNSNDSDMLVTENLTSGEQSIDNGNNTHIKIPSTSGPSSMATHLSYQSVSSLIGNGSSVSSHNVKAAFVNTYTHSQNHLPSHSSPTTPNYSTSPTWTISPARIVIAEEDTVDINWVCPPTAGSLSSYPERTYYDWYRVSSQRGSYRDPLSSFTDPVSRRSVLRMQRAGIQQEGRYFCTGRETSLFNVSSPLMEMHFYQLLVLRSLWVNIGSVSTMTLYRGQRAVINCPFGDIVRNNATLSRGRLCSGRMSILESPKEDLSTPGNDIWEHYRCTDSDKVTTKTPPHDSSRNCSMSLLGCVSNGRTGRFRRATSTNEPDEFPSGSNDLLHLDKCLFKPLAVPVVAGVSDDGFCPGNGSRLFLRYYFDIFKGKCFPFETSKCHEDTHSFQSLLDCQKTCVSISGELERCFLPVNIDRSKECSKMSLKGLYRVSYDFETNTCRWFYQCGSCSNLSRNVFHSFRQCEELCVRNKPRIIAESIKACNYLDEGKNSIPRGFNGSLKLHNRWTYDRFQQRCELKPYLSGQSTRTGLFQFQFSSRKMCENTCRTMGSHEICQSRPENGVCSKKRLQWHFNVAEGKCIQILDGGCGDSLNRFNSREACERVCARLKKTKTPGTASSTKHTTMPSRFTLTSTQTPTSRLPVITSVRRDDQLKPVTFVKMRRRFHRKIADHAQNSGQRREKIASQARRNIEPSKSAIKVTDRKLDFDPCLKDAIKGTCDYGFGRTTYRMNRYSFDVQSGRCHIVRFSGCLGGQNLFDDANDCKASCEYRLRAYLKSPSCQNPYTGTCVVSDQSVKASRSIRFFFFSMTGECIRFTSVDTPGCLAQFFETEEQCKKRCSLKPPMEHMLQNRCFGKIVQSDSSCPADYRIDLWFFFSDINQCIQYTTCPVDIDGNVFLTRLDCEQACRATNMIVVCELPVDSGKGVQSTARYYYDSEMGKCRLFYYRGSFGNLNRFATKTECKRACYRANSGLSVRNTPLVMPSPRLPNDSLYHKAETEESWLNDMADTEYCYDHHHYGACASTDQPVFMKKYYYDSFRKQCEPYMFSGCGTLSRNSFDSIDLCDRMCTERISRIKSSLCSQKVTQCSDSSWVYWTYNPTRGLCEPFPSCIKKSDSQFFFTNEKHCSEVCVPPVPMKRDHFDICHLVTSHETNCSEPSRRWFYERGSRSCRSTISCEFYGNNFPSLAACHSACEPSTLLETCQLPMDKGPCHINSTILMYHFDWASQTCKPFAYGGCLGNRNRFQTYTACNLMCPVLNRCNPTSHNISNCKITKKTDSKLFFFNPTSNKCQLWTEPVCGVETQLFPTLPDCVNECVVSSEFKSIVYTDKRRLHIRCFEKLKFNNYPLCGHTLEWLPRFYYDHDHDQCIFFYYNACNGTEDAGNRFSSSSQCRKHCGRETDDLTSTKQKTISTRPPRPTARLWKPAHDTTVKSGFCPGINRPCPYVMETLPKCRTDSDCAGIQKCCSCEMSQSIVPSCMEPIGCMATEFGCCRDGLTMAGDELHNTCPPQPAEIEASLPERHAQDSGEDLILNCYVTGDPKPSITWVHHGPVRKSFPVESHWDIIQPLWSGSLRIPASDTPYGVWSCQAATAAGWDEKETYIHNSETQEDFLRLYSPDGKNSTSESATRQSDVSLHCPIYGVPRPSIVWFYNRTPVTNRSLKSVSMFQRRLSITHVDSVHEGTWHCEARNALTRLMIFTIYLTLLDPAKMPAPQSRSIKAAHGQNIIMLCGGRSGRLKNKQYDSIQWFWEIGNRSVAIHSGLLNDSRILVVPNFQAEHYSGSYVCRVSHGDVEEKIKYTIVPYGVDEISVEPAGMLFTGMTVTLRCPAPLLFGPSKMYQVTVWNKDGNYCGETKSNELELTLRSKADSGLYACRHNSKMFSTHLFVHEEVLVI